MMQDYPLHVLVISFAISLIVFVLYVWNFGVGFSPDYERWGSFGDYFGGTLNPILGFLTLTALLLTILLQNRQLELARIEIEDLKIQTYKDDIYKMITSIFQEFREVTGLTTEYKSITTPNPIEKWMFIEEQIPVVGSGGLTHHIPTKKSILVKGLPKCQYRELFGVAKDIDRYNDLPEANTDLGEYNTKQFQRYIQYIIELYPYLSAYEKITGNDDVTKYYKRRCTQACSDLYHKKYLDQEIFNFFVGHT